MCRRVREQKWWITECGGRRYRSIPTSGTETGEFVEYLLSIWFLFDRSRFLWQFIIWCFLVRSVSNCCHVFFNFLLRQQQHGLSWRIVIPRFIRAQGNDKQLNSQQATTSLQNQLTDTYLPPFYPSTSTGSNTGLPPMPFPYLNAAGISDGTWSTGVPSLNPNTLFPSSGFSAVGNGEQLLQDQMFNHNAGVPVSTNAYLSSLSHNSQAPPALYFPGTSTDISWGEQSQGPPMLPNFYQPDRKSVV